MPVNESRPQIIDFTSIGSANIGYISIAEGNVLKRNLCLPYINTLCTLLYDKVS